MNTGLHATLLVRHPDDGRLYVNLDQEVPQLVCEAKCLERMGVEVRAFLICLPIYTCQCGYMWGGMSLACLLSSTSPTYPSNPPTPHRTQPFQQISEPAKMVLFQEERLKGHYHDLRWLLDEYHRVVTRVIPVTVCGLWLWRLLNIHSSYGYVRCF